ncbi:hypothetical protein M0805_005149 [Coniferiporia weirii]|nr:hypothetical protein M0805_005149 [Coniferiporia weirii]
MSTDAQGATPNTRKRTRATMQSQDASVPAQPQATDDGFIADNDAAESGGDEDEEETGKVSDKKAGRRKIKIEFIQDKSRRHITFSKRKAGIMKKAYELSTLTGTQVLLLVVSETGLVYTFTTAKLQPLVTQPEGKNLIQACLNAPHGALPSNMPVGPPLGRSAPQQIQSQQAQAGGPNSPNQAQAQMPGMPNIGGARNVPGGLAIGGSPGGQGAPGVEDDGDGDRGHEDVDAEGDKRGGPRRRTSTSKNAGGSGRSPTSPGPHLNMQPGAAPQAPGAPGMPMGAYSQPAAPGQPEGQGGPPPGQMYHPMMGAPNAYYAPPGMGGAWAPPPSQGGPPSGPYRR